MNKDWCCVGYVCVYYRFIINLSTAAGIHARHHIWQGNAFLITGHLWGDPPVISGFPNKGPVSWSLDDLFWWHLNKLWTNSIAESIDAMTLMGRHFNAKSVSTVSINHRALWMWKDEPAYNKMSERVSDMTFYWTTALNGQNATTVLRNWFVWHCC